MELHVSKLRSKGGTKGGTKAQPGMRQLRSVGMLYIYIYPIGSKHVFFYFARCFFRCNLVTIKI